MAAMTSVFTPALWLLKNTLLKSRLAPGQDLKTFPKSVLHFCVVYRPNGGTFLRKELWKVPVGAKQTHFKLSTLDFFFSVHLNLSWY